MKNNIEDPSDQDLNSGIANAGLRQGQTHHPAKLAQADQNRSRNQYEREEIAMQPGQSKPEDNLGQDEGRRCGRCYLSRKKIGVIVVVSVLVLAAIIIPIAVIFSQKAVQIPPNYDYLPISYRGKNIETLQSTVTQPDSISYTTLQSTGPNKTEATEPFTQTSAACSSGEDKAQLLCNLTVPVLAILSSSQWLQVQERDQWLAEFNRDPRAFVEKFLLAARRVLQARAQGDQDKLSILQVEEKNLVDVIYNTDKQVFELAKYDKTEGQAEAKEKTEADAQLKQNSNSTDTKKNQIDDVLTKASTNLKQIISRNLEALKKGSQQIMEQSRKLTGKDETINEEWQKALIEKCRAIGLGLFRCSRKAVDKLVPGFNPDQIPDDAVVTYAFAIKLRQSTI